MLSWTFNHIQNFNFIPQVFVRYCGLKNPAFWFVLRFLVHNSRTRFLETCCFCKKYKRNIGTLRCCSLMHKTFAKTLKTLLWVPLNPPSQAHLNFSSKIGICLFSYFMMWNFMGKKQKKLMIQKSYIADKWENGGSQISRIPLLRWVSN